MREVSDGFGVWVPAGRAVNPVTGKDWEGTGVIPDVPVFAAAAVRTAHVRALRKILAAERDPNRQEMLHQVLEEVSRGAESS
jgi:hypothetical protein